MESLWLDALNQVKDLTSNPEVFLDPSSCESHFNNSKVITKVLYDAAKLIESESTSNSNSKKGKRFKKYARHLLDYFKFRTCPQKGGGPPDTGYLPSCNTTRDHSSYPVTLFFYRPRFYENAARVNH